MVVKAVHKPANTRILRKSFRLHLDYKILRVYMGLCDLILKRKTPATQESGTSGDSQVSAVQIAPAGEGRSGRQDGGKRNESKQRKDSEISSCANF